MRKQRKGAENVELNLAAMLDMAFQLLTFFILTFKPSPIEGQVDLRLPPPMPVTKLTDDGTPIGERPPADIGVESLVISIFSKPDGQIGSLAIGDSNIAGLAQLDSELKKDLADPGSPFKQVIIQVGSSLHYEELMRVIDICTRQTMADGSKLTRLSFVELPEGNGN